MVVSKIPEEYLLRQDEFKAWLEQNGNPEISSDPGQVGLKNQGATCYLNSLLQSFFCLPEFANAIAEWEYESRHGNKEQCLPYQFQVLFAQMSHSRRNAVSTKAFTKSCGFGQSDVFQQHDVQELCRILFDAIEQSSKPLYKNLKELFEVSSIEFLRSKENPIEHASEKLAENLDISLPLEDRDMKLEEAFRSMLEVENLTDDNQWFCEKANAKVDAERGIKFQTFPNVLAIHLMRFVYDRVTFRRKKLANAVDIPLELDLGEFCEGAGTYSLSAVCFHKGTGYYGHYYAWTRMPGDEWMVCNDDVKQYLRTTLGGERDATMMEETGRLAGDLSAPYFLLYRKKDLQVPALIPNPHVEALLKENEEFDDMHKLYTVHQSVTSVKIMNMKNHLLTVQARIGKWMKKFNLHTRIDCPDDSAPNEIEEFQMISTQNAADLNIEGTTLYHYDTSMARATSEIAQDVTISQMNSMSIDYHKSPLLRCDGPPPEGDTLLLLFKDGRLEYENAIQCLKAGIDAAAKQMANEAEFELLKISNVNKELTVLGPWRRTEEFVIVDTGGFRKVYDESVNGLMIEHTKLDSGDCDETIFVKKQITLGELKTQICAKYELDPATVHLRRQRKNLPLKTDDEAKPLEELDFYDHTPVFLCSGEPVKTGYYSYEIMLKENTNSASSKKALIGNVILSESATIVNLRQKVFELCVEKKINGSGETASTLQRPNQIRLQTDTPGTSVLRDTITLRRACLVADGKQLDATILEEDEDLEGKALVGIRWLDYNSEKIVHLPKDLIVESTISTKDLAARVYESLSVESSAEGLVEIEDLETTTIQYFAARNSIKEMENFDWTQTALTTGMQNLKDNNLIVARSRSQYEAWKKNRRRSSQSSGGKESSSSEFAYSRPPAPLAITSGVEKQLVISVAVPDNER